MIEPSFTSVSSIPFGDFDRTKGVRRILLSCVDLMERNPCSIIEKVDFCQETEEDWKSKDDCLYISHDCHNYLMLGVIYFHAFNYKKSLQCLKKAEERSQRFYTEKDMNRLTASFFKDLFVVLAQVLSHNSQGNREEILKYVSRSLDLIKGFPDKDLEKTFYSLRGYPIKDIRDTFLLLLVKGDVGAHDKAYEQAEEHYLEALKLLKNRHEPRLSFLAYSRLVLLCARFNRLTLEYFEDLKKYWALIEESRRDCSWKNSYLEGVYYLSRALVSLYGNKCLDSKDDYERGRRILKERLPADNCLESYYEEVYQSLLEERGDRQAEKSIGLNDTLREVEVGMARLLNQEMP